MADANRTNESPLSGADAPIFPNFQQSSELTSSTNSTESSSSDSEWSSAAEDSMESSDPEDIEPFPSGPIADFWKILQEENDIDLPDFFQSITDYLAGKLAFAELLNKITQECGDNISKMLTELLVAKGQIPMDYFPAHLLEKPTQKKKGSSSQGRRKKVVKKRPEKWTGEENTRLMKLVEKYPENTSSPNRWTVIAKNMGDKTPSQCFQHWNRVLNPAINKGPWTEEEETLLLAIVESLSNEGEKLSWAAVAAQLRGRTDTQCRYYYSTCIKSRVASWVPYEDSELSRIVMERTRLGYLEWTEIAKSHYRVLLSDKKTQYKTPRRSALDCKQRWDYLSSR